MDSNYLRDIEGLEILVKRLKSAMSVLKRDNMQEKKERENAKKLSAGYNSLEEAHEAYGWDYITEREFDRICEIFNGDDISPTKIALKKMQQMINNVEGEIKMLRQDDDYRENFKTIKNERGAGRKPSLSELEKSEIIKHRKNGFTIRVLARDYKVSVGTVQKLINEHLKTG